MFAEDLIHNKSAASCTWSPERHRQSPPPASSGACSSLVLVCCREVCCSSLDFFNACPSPKRHCRGPIPQDGQGERELIPNGALSLSKWWPRQAVVWKGGAIGCVCLVSECKTVRELFALVLIGPWRRGGGTAGRGRGRSSVLCGLAASDRTVCTQSGARITPSPSRASSKRVFSDLG